MKVELAPQVVDFVRSLPPQPRALLRRGLKGLVQEKGDIKRLEGSPSDYCRLRVHGYRVIFSYAKRGTIQCIFAEQRSIVYEVFASRLAEKLLGVDE